MEDLGVDRGGGAQGLRRCHAVLDQQLQFTSLVAVSEDADVAAVGNGDTRFEGGLEGRALSFHFIRFGLAPLSPTAILAHGLSGRQSRAQGHAAVGHEPEDLDIALVAMFDGLDSGKRGPAHAFLRHRMRRHRAAG